jgi:N-methylhydantoinase A/oxoprolinase/acetone carboxylase beta subunit
MDVLLGVDVGGTFTDFVAYDLESRSINVWKVPSVPGDPVAGILEGILQELPSEVIRLLRLGTTVATNAILERKGATVAYGDSRLPRCSIHPARQPQVPLRHELGEAQAAREASPLLRDH